MRRPQADQANRRRTNLSGNSTTRAVPTCRTPPRPPHGGARPARHAQGDSWVRSNRRREPCLDQSWPGLAKRRKMLRIRLHLRL